MKTLSKHSIVSLFLLFSTSLFNGFAQIPKDGLVAHYPFNGNANDMSGNGNHGIIYGATLTTDRCEKPNSAYYFDGKSYIRVPYSPSLNSHTNELTVSFWAYSNSANLNPICKSGWATYDIDYRIQVFNGALSLIFNAHF